MSGGSSAAWNAQSVDVGFLSQLALIGADPQAALA